MRPTLGGDQDSLDCLLLAFEQLTFTPPPPVRAVSSTTARELQRPASLCTSNDVHIHEYTAKINPLGKAVAYAIQDHGELIVEEISGSFTNVVGLPLERVEAELGACAKPG